MGLFSGAIGKLELSSTGLAPTVGTFTASVGTFVMSGLGATLAFTPKQSGNILVIVSATIGNSTTADGCQFKLAWGTGTAPAINAAASGTVISGVYAWTALTGVLNVSATMIGFIAGAVIGTALWVDAQGADVTGGLRTMSSVNGAFIELP